MAPSTAPLVLQQLVPRTTEFSFAEWWLTSRKRLAADDRKPFDSFAVLVFRLIWKDRNSRVFDKKAVIPCVLYESTYAEGRLRSLAGFSTIYAPRDVGSRI